VRLIDGNELARLETAMQASGGETSVDQYQQHHEGDTEGESRTRRGRIPLKHLGYSTPILGTAGYALKKLSSH
jgi:hypothetical protein